MPDIDIDRICVMYQQTWPAHRKYDVRHTDGNVNLTDATHTALHVSVWSAWSQAPQSRRKIWQPRLWRFKGGNVDPGALQGGMAETTFVPAWSDVHRGAVASLWRKRVQWRNKARASDFTWDVSQIGIDFPSWMPFAGPQHIQWRKRLASWRAYLSMSSAQQQFVQTGAAATTSAPVGNIHYTGGRFVL